MSFICSLLHSSVVLMSSMGTCDLMQWNVSVMTDSKFFFWLPWAKHLSSAAFQSKRIIQKLRKEKKIIPKKTQNH